MHKLIVEDIYANIFKLIAMFSFIFKVISLQIILTTNIVVLGSVLQTTLDQCYSVTYNTGSVLQCYIQTNHFVGLLIISC